MYSLFLLSLQVMKHSLAKCHNKFAFLQVNPNVHTHAYTHIDSTAKRTHSKIRLHTLCLRLYAISLRAYPKIWNRNKKVNLTGRHRNLFDWQVAPWHTFCHSSSGRKNNKLFLIFYKKKNTKRRRNMLTIGECLKHNKVFSCQMSSKLCQ